MNTIKDKLKNNANDLEKAYLEDLKISGFKSLVKDLGIDLEVGKYYTSKLEECVVELNNCKHCKGIYMCKNKLDGYYLYPIVLKDVIDTGFVKCHYKKEALKLLSLRQTANSELEKARFKTIDVKDKKRVEVIKWLKKFYDEYDGIKNIKGIYLHGSFGSGKTYLLYALLNELKINKKVEFIALYYPKILRNLKDDWDYYEEKIDKYSKVPILLIDDIGAEQVSEWSRDEVLGTILQDRMNNNLVTFFTSNLTIEELESHFTFLKSGEDEIKARRIIERIKQLTIDMELISQSRRN